MIKKRIIIIALVLIQFTLLNGQSEFGLRFGLSSYNVDQLEKINLESISDLSEMSIETVDFGFHAGIYGRIMIKAFFIEPSVLFNSHSASYNIKSDSLGVNINSVKREFYQNIDVPLMVGIKIAAVNVHAGPVAHFHLNSSSELFEFTEYDQRFKEATFGYQAGIGINIKKLRIDINYEGNLEKFANHMNISGSEISFSKAPSRIIGSVGIAF